MKHFEEFRKLAQRRVNPNRDVVPPQLPIAEKMDVDDEQARSDAQPPPQTSQMPVPEHVVIDNPQSLWGHRLRQNVRGGLLLRGFDMDLVDIPNNPVLKDVRRPKDDDGDKVKAAEFSSFWEKDVLVWPRMLLQTIDSYKPGICKLCARTMTNITRHHVHPKFGAKSERKPPPGMVNYPRDYLIATIDLCRPCHSLIHYIIPNKLMSDSYYSLPLLESHPRVQAWVSWVRRQRIPPSRPFKQLPPTRVLRSARKRKAEKVEPQRILRSAKNRTAKKIHAGAEKVEIHLNSSKLNLSDTKDALARLWADSGNTIPGSLVDLPALQKKLSESTGGGRVRTKNIRKALFCNPEYQAWCNMIFPSLAHAEGGNKSLVRPNKAAAREALNSEDRMMGMIKDALNKIWRDNDNDFPRFPIREEARGKALREAVKICMGKAVNAPIPLELRAEDLQRSMQLLNKYRLWFEWTYPSLIWAPLGQTVTSSGVADEAGDDDGDVEMGGVDNSAGRGFNHGGMAVHTPLTGTGTRADPIIFDDTDDEEEKVASSVGRGNLTVSRSGRVVIDLTMDDDDG
ncbi:hypothetical protein N0V93_006015 [Gnomoniopsis smithogilvyi]|uniref:Uncharacterized protein n=1 Tax=Gnomoniopsis smithogilvyi TaxID=1191159 RepID=A0A9W8YMH9_9PEZI|nr:hypothetical protein N0V93_006015 [Gnomoniopsis smithogilvyi]